MLCGKKELWHEHLIDLAPLSEIEHSSNAPDVIAAITGAQGRKFGFSLIEQERERERLAILDSLASGPERQILIYTLDEAAQLSYEYDGEGIPIDARIKNYCFEGDPVLDRWRRWQAEDEAEDEIWASPTLTPSEEALIDAEMLAMSDKIPKGINKPQYTHPDRRTLPEANHGVGRQIHRQPRWAREMSAPSSRRRRKSPVSAKIKLTN